MPRLSVSVPVTLDANGHGTARIGPIGAREKWSAAIVHVKTNQAPASIVNEAQCYIYAGPSADDQYFVDSTSSGSTGDSTDSIAAFQVVRGEFVFAVWSGGDAGAQGIMRVTGTREV